MVTTFISLGWLFLLLTVTKRPQGLEAPRVTDQKRDEGRESETDSERVG